jgi:hypothetical protein
VDRQSIATNLLNSHIFSNILAGLPITLYVGNIPKDVDDNKIMRIFEVSPSLPFPALSSPFLTLFFVELW